MALFDGRAVSAITYDGDSLATLARSFRINNGSRAEVVTGVGDVAARYVYVKPDPSIEINFRWADGTDETWEHFMGIFTSGDYTDSTSTGKAFVATLTTGHSVTMTGLVTDVQLDYQQDNGIVEGTVTLRCANGSGVTVA